MQQLPGHSSQAMREFRKTHKANWKNRQGKSEKPAREILHSGGRNRPILPGKLPQVAAIHPKSLPHDYNPTHTTLLIHNYLHEKALAGKNLDAQYLQMQNFRINFANEK
ncbi:MAG: hypothetical protein ACOYJE_07860 [Bacteroidaceae bacterium]|jgi:hypothetical protein